MMTKTRLLAAALSSMLAVAAASGQDAPNLSGRVRSVSGVPIEGVEVSIDGASMSTRTDRVGKFAFVKAPKGLQVLRFRLLGYLPSRADVRVPTTDSLEVRMLPTPRSLDTVKVTASVNVLAGVVVGLKDKPVPGASVDMLASGTTTVTTDSSGWFTFTSVRDGTVLLRVRKLGFEPLTTTIRLEDWRGLVIHLEPLDYNLTGSKLETASGFGARSEFVWTETQHRLLVRGVRSIVVPREELAPYDDLPLEAAIMRTPTGARLSGDLSSAGNSVCVLLNGSSAVGPTPLNSYRTADVEFVELYPPGTEESGSVAHNMRNVGCRRVHIPGTFEVGMFYAVVWLRN